MFCPLCPEIGINKTGRVRSRSIDIIKMVKLLGKYPPWSLRTFLQKIFF